MNRILIIPLFFTFYISSCQKLESEATNSDPVKIELTQEEAKVAGANRSGGVQLISFISEKESISNKRENIIVSPLSLNLALAMTWNGAAGQTKAEIQKVLGLDGMVEEDVNNYFKKMVEQLPASDKKAKFTIANSIWNDKKIVLREEFIKKNKNFFGASVSALDFNEPTSLTTINKWCYNNTNGLIDKILDEIKKDDAVFLINALYFKAPWKIKFKEELTQDALFTTWRGDTRTVKMMYASDKFLYAESPKMKLAGLAFGNGSFNMIFVLPNEGYKLWDITDELSSNKTWSGILESMRETQIDLFIPKFKVAYEIELNDYLKSQGMVLPFSDNADFSKMSSTALKISKVKQKAVIEIDEKGGEAAAVTSVGMVVTSIGPNRREFRADRPFLFLINETSTGTILFAGKVEMP